MSSPVSELIKLLTLERLEDNLFRGQSRDIGTKYVFGGQVLGQALSATQATLDTARHAHSLHAYFLRAGDTDHPIVYQVDRTRDGGSFSVRRVTAIQHGKPIFFLAASFQQEETGGEHQLTMPEVPKPEDIEPSATVPADVLAKLPIKVQRWLSRMGPFEFRHVYPRDELNPPKRPPFQQVWFRLSERVGDAPELHRALLAYASDFHLLGTATFPHGISYYQPNVQMASLDHALWFHRPFRADEWLLYSIDSPTAQGARGLARGLIYDRDGKLVASTAQEGLIRVADDAGAGRIEHGERARMRQVFSSPRMENVERVAKLLGDAGIDARITHGRSYKGGLRGDFSYRDHVRVDPIPAVWIVKSEDQPAAREILRAAGLLDSTRGETGYTLPVFRTEEPLTIVEPGRKRAFRLKVGLLGVIAMVIVLAFVSTRKPAVAPVVALPAGDSATPDGLAQAVLAGELPTRPGQGVCLSVDGHDPAPALLTALAAPHGVVIPESRCLPGPQTLHLAVSAYRTRPGTASGTIELTRRRGTALIATHHYDVRPEGAGWRVIEPMQ